MSTRTAHDSVGQIALMDAMVFFAVALLICSIQLSTYREGAEPDDQFAESDGRSDPGCVLPVFLRASIGTATSVRVDCGLAVPAHTTISDCLAAEATALVRGVTEDAFSDLNRLILGAAKNLSHPTMNPHVILNHHTEHGVIVLLRIEYCLPSSGDVIAATSDLLDCGDVRVAVSFLLEPALLPEGRGV